LLATPFPTLAVLKLRRFALFALIFALGLWMFLFLAALLPLPGLILPLLPVLSLLTTLFLLVLLARLL
jgi:hypothetical protein